MIEAAPVHARSEGAVNPALRVFKVPPTDISIDAYHMVNQVYFPSQWGANNTNKAGNHLQWQGLSANHKAASFSSL